MQKDERMIVPFIALIVVLVLVGMYMAKSARHKDKGNRPESGNTVS